MRIGYACLNSSVGCTSARTFRLKSYSERRLLETVAANLACLEKILQFNLRHGLLFFRLASGLVPFASHPVNRCDWAGRFACEFARLGRFAREHGMRLCLHPDQFILLNSPRPEVLQSSLRELAYHARLLDLMEQESCAKIQIHVGGIYGDKAGSMRRFVAAYRRLDEAVRRRLVIENDDRHYTLRDCLDLHAGTGVPVVLDRLHHRLNGYGESDAAALALAAATWTERDGPPLVDYSDQAPGGVPGKHAVSVCPVRFLEFWRSARPFTCDIMLEAKGKEQSALEVRAALAGAGLLP